MKYLEVKNLPNKFTNLLRSIQLCCTELNPNQLMKHAGRSLKKNMSHNKIIDLSLLPPCKSVLKLHSKRANAVAYLQRNASNPTTEFPSLTENGWATTGDIEWIEEAFPAEVGELTARDEDNGENEDDYGSDVESSDDEDYDDVFLSLKTVFMADNLAKF